MSDFSIKPIETTAEKLEKIANMHIDDINIDENSNNNSLPTSKVVREAIMGETEKYLPLQAETEWVFDGGDASSEINILYKIDDTMSDTSNNAVKNKVIKKYVDDKAKQANQKVENIETELSYVNDYIVEQSISGMLSYRKWKSGIGEIWGHISLNFKDTRCLNDGLELPFAFWDLPTVNLNMINGEANSNAQGAIALSSTYTSGSKGIIFSLVRDEGGYRSGDTVYVGYHIIGKIKAE